MGHLAQRFSTTVWGKFELADRTAIAGTAPENLYVFLTHTLSGRTALQQDRIYISYGIVGVRVTFPENYTWSAIGEWPHFPPPGNRSDLSVQRLNRLRV